VSRIERGIDTTWSSVPRELDKAWMDIFYASQEGLNVSAPCPVCGTASLHRWYQVGRPEERFSDGRRYVARGGQWQWCSTCRTFDHSSSLVPEWWSCDLPVDEARLTMTPGAIEQARLEVAWPHSSS
jgi:hypothetical protein